MTFTQQWIGAALRSRCLAFICILLLGLMASSAFAHAVTAGDKGYIQEISGVNLLPFMYLGAKHMMTGYDHILFLFGVIFFLYRPSHIGIYVSLFALGHSTTMNLGVYFNVGINTVSRLHSLDVNNPDPRKIAAKLATGKAMNEDNRASPGWRAFTVIGPKK